MGYQSDVAYTIRFKNEADYRLFILEAKADPLKANCFNEVDCDDQRYRIDFKANNVKWYESYPDVQMHEKLLEQAEEWCNDDDHQAVREDGEAMLFNGRDYRVGYVFVRVGEDHDDVERKEGGNSDYEWLYVRRTIECG